MTNTSLSPAMRAEIKFLFGRVTLQAVQAHLYHKSMGYFNPMADWQITDILELSEMADRLKKLAVTLRVETPLKMEAARIAKIVDEDFNVVYTIAMERLSGGYKVA